MSAAFFEGERPAARYLGHPTRSQCLDQLLQTPPKHLIYLTAQEIGRTNNKTGMTNLKQSQTSTHGCMTQLRADILDGLYPIGTRLPAERRLAERLGVNRVTIRSALGHLAGAGLLTVRQGAGYEVRDFHRQGGPHLIQEVASRSQQKGDFEDVVKDMLLVRRQLAAGLLERLHTRAPSNQSRLRILAAVERFEQAANDRADTERLAELDLEIVSNLIEATKSPVLSLCMNPIVAALSAFPSLRGAIYTNPSENVAGWKALCEWLLQPHEGTVEPIVKALWERDQQTLKRLFKTEKA